MIIIFPENDLEDEGPSKGKKEKRAREDEEVADRQELHDGEASEGEEVEEAEDDIELQGEGDSEEDGRPSQASSMSNRTESKPYSSVTHKCGVRHKAFVGSGVLTVSDFNLS